MSLPKPLKRASMIFICVAAAFVALVFLINMSLFDEELNPAIVEEIKPINMPPATQNAYIALWGLAASDEIDFIEAGRQVLVRHQEKLAASDGNHSFSEQDFNEIFGGSDFDSVWLEGREACGPRVAFGCLTRSKAYIESVKSNARLQNQIRRYQRMISLPFYKENYWDSYADELPSYLTPLAISQNYLSILYFDESPEFLRAMADDMKFWRRALDAEANLITKMIAVAAIWRNCLFISEYMLNEELEEAEASKIREMLVPLTTEELNIKETWRMERHPFMSAADFSDPIYYDATREDTPSIFLRWMMKGLTQINATKNMSYSLNWKPLEKMSGLSANELYQLIEQAKESGLTPMQQFTHQGEKIRQLASLSVLYNLFGKLYHVEMQWDASGYMERVHDLGGMVNLVNLQLEIMQSEEEVLSVVTHSQYKNPHTLEPMKYDAEKNILFFTCRDKAGVCKISL